ncbi:DnaJ-domain-containing protein [Tothia fuscella]|uniref:DnaJ-domain-containing protein n=1 Tax=Tothia fuscella TaxID=1048955 RepID=A0A9P4NM23_9PEZI|nr:DnaJ-domain-containing protein [Tothia fuscella]
MPSKTEDLPDDLDTNINPYKVLGIEKSSTADQIKSAYRKLALKNHPDKVPGSEKESAKEEFQKLSFAYGILSDPRRRSRYDTTGRTNETLHLDDEDDFNWSDFFRHQFEDIVTSDAIARFKEEYQGSEEEKLDVIAAYVTYEGDMDAVFEEVMLSNPLEDEERFRKMIDEEIEEKRVEAYDAYVKETKSKRKKRITEAKKEAKEAMEMAKELGVEDKLFGKSNGANGKKGKKGEEDISGLQALIQQRQKSRQEDFFDNLAAKYGAKEKSGKKNKRMAEDDEPSEEAFQRTAQRMRKGKKAAESMEVEHKPEVEGRRSKRTKR